MKEQEIKKIIEKILSELKSDSINNSIQDISKTELSQVTNIPNPNNSEGFNSMRGTSDARLGVWRTGPRYLTSTLLRYLADNAAAMDAVFTNVSEDTIKNNNLFEIKTLCESKDEYLTRPDLGRKLSSDMIDKVKRNCISDQKLQIIVSDGLSSTAVDSNISDLLSAFYQGLNHYGIETKNPIFLKFGRVPAMDVITEVLNPTVTIIFIGERPGLSNSESLSAYITYEGYIGMPEVERVVISNIHSKGTNALEAGATIAEIVFKMLK